MKHEKKSSYTVLCYTFEKLGANTGETGKWPFVRPQGGLEHLLGLWQNFPTGSPKQPLGAGALAACWFLPKKVAGPTVTIFKRHQFQQVYPKSSWTVVNRGLNVLFHNENECATRSELDATSEEGATTKFPVSLGLTSICCVWAVKGSLNVQHFLYEWELNICKICVRKLRSRNTGSIVNLRWCQQKLFFVKGTKLSFFSLLSIQ